MNSTQLTDFNNYDVKRMIFSKPEVGNIPGAKLTFKRVRISTNNPDGTIGDLIIATPPNLLCYGIQEQTDPGSGVVNGYQFPFVLWNRGDPSPQEKAFTEAVHRICDHCKNHLITHKEEIEMYDLELNDLKKFNPLHYKTEKGKVVEGRSPTFYIKTMTSKKDGNIKIQTVFTDEDTNQVISPMDLMGKRCYIQGAVKFESVFIGNKISLQVKLFEARVKVVDTSFHSLLGPTPTIPQQQSTNTAPTVPATFTDVANEDIADAVAAVQHEEDDESSSSDEDDENEPQQPAIAPTQASAKPPVKRAPAKKK